MSKFLLNLLLQIFKALVYSKNKFYSEKKFFIHFRPFSPTAAHFFSFFSTGHCSPRPPPHWASASRPAHLALSAQLTARRWCPAGLPPPTRENVSPRASFTSLRAWLIGGPHPSSPSSGAARAPLRAVASSSRHDCRALPLAPLSLWLTVTTP
jgi:hypothetical protein